MGGLWVPQRSIIRLKPQKRSGQTVPLSSRCGQGAKASLPAPGWQQLPCSRAASRLGQGVASVLGGRMLAPLVQVVSQWQSVVNVRDAWTRLEALLSAVPAEPAAMELPAPRGVVQVEQLVAGAPGSSSAILRGISFVLQPGDVVTSLFQPLSFTVLGATGKNEELNFEAQGILAVKINAKEQQTYAFINWLKTAATAPPQPG